MIKRPNDQLPGISTFLDRKSTRWSFGNRILYDMCAENPLHNDEDIIVGKIWIVGRCYAAAIERRKTNTDFDGDFYYEVVAPKLLSIGPELDARIAEINKYTIVTEENLDLVLTTHKILMDAFYEITDLEKRSLASKYLHFHCPSMFFIYDSRANNEIRNRVKLDRPRAEQHYLCGGDKEYADFCIRMLEFREFVADKFGKTLSPREMDNLMLYS